MNTLSRNIQLISAIVATTFSGDVVLAADGPQPASPDTSRWECEYCPVDQDSSGHVIGSLPWLDSSDEAYADFNGLDKGLNPSVSATFRSRDGEGGHTDILLEDFGLMTARMRLDTGQQGDWDLSMRYQLIPHLTGFDAMTPFRGGRDLTLPANWVPGATSNSMLFLDASSRPITLGVDRRRIALAFSMPLQDRWQLDADFRHETVRGHRAIGANILTTISRLAAPIDRATDAWHLGGSWQGERVLASIDYRVSRYTDGIHAISWDNPFIAGLGGATQGRSASTPSNDFQMLSGDVSIDLPWRTRISLGFGAGTGEQNDPFVAATINPNLVVPVLPRTSLRGEVDVTRWNLRVTSRPMRKLSLRFAYHYDDRDNQTPIALFPEVTTDSVVGGFAANVPYDFRRERMELGADFRITSGIRAGVDLSTRSHRRGSQEVLKTDEDRVAANLRAQVGPRLLVTLELEDVDRSGSDYNIVPGITDAQNPRLRKYYMADMDRTGGRLRFDLQIRDDMALGIEHRSSDDYYPDTEVGLIEGSTTASNIDLAWSPNERMNLVAFLNQQRARSMQAGSSSFATANWQAVDRDDILVFGSHIEYALDGPWSLNAGLELSRYDGDTEVFAGGPSSAFPTLRSDLTRVELGLAHADESAMAYRFGIIWERLATDDWALDGLGNSTIPAMVALGLTSPEYDIVLVYAEFEYGF